MPAARPAIAASSSAQSGSFRTLYACYFEPFVIGDGSAANNVIFANCFLSGGAYIFGGEDNFSTWIQGGTVQGGSLVLGTGHILDCDVIVGRTTDVAGDGLWGTVHLAGIVATWTGHSAGIAIQPVLAGAGIVWGASTIDVNFGGEVINNTAGTWASSLQVSTLNLDASSTGTVYNKDAVGDQFTPGFAVTTLNLDAYNGLQNPLTGSRYSNPNGTSVATGGTRKRISI